MANLSQTDRLGKTVFFHRPPEAIALRVVFGLNVSMFVSRGCGVQMNYAFMKTLLRCNLNCFVKMMFIPFVDVK